MVLNRTRTRGAISTFPSPSILWGSVVGTNTSQRYPVLLETFTDVANGARQSGVYRVKPCSHSVIEGDHSAPGPYVLTNDSSDIRYLYTDWYPPLALPSTDLNPPGWDSDGLWMDKQLRVFAEAVPAEVSLPNFIYELGDVKDLIPQITSLLKRLSTRSVETFGRRVRKAVSLTADAYLLKTFGIDTLINDIDALMHSMDRLDKRLRWLQRNNRKDVSVRRRQMGTVDYSNASWNFLGPKGFASNFRTVRSAFTARVIRVASARTRLNYSDLNGPMARYQAMASYFGFGKPISVIWEAIPFSWLIDYFLNIQEIIDSIPSVPAFAGTSTLRDPCFSRKWEMVSPYRLTKEGSSAIYTVVNGKFFEPRRHEVYNRLVGQSVPSANSLGSYLSSDLTSAQVKNLLAVLGQKFL